LSQNFKKVLSKLTRVVDITYQSFQLYCQQLQANLPTTNYYQIRFQVDEDDAIFLPDFDQTEVNKFIHDVYKNFTRGGCVEIAASFELVCLLMTSTP